MIPEEIFRLGLCALLAVHFIERARQLGPVLGESDLPKSWFTVAFEPVLVLATIAGISLALGLLPRISALLLLGAAVTTRHAVPYFSHLADHIVSIMCLWACVLPLGRSLRVTDIIRNRARIGRAATAALNAPTLPSQLFRIQIALLLVDWRLWHANVLGWTLPPTQHALMALPPMLSLLPRYRWLAFGLHIVMMSLLLFEAPNTTAGLLLLAGVIFVSRPPFLMVARAPGSTCPRPVPLQALPALSLMLIATSASSTASHFINTSQSPAADRLLGDIGFDPPRSPRRSSVARVTASARNAEGQQLGQVYDGWHERILISYLAERSWAVLPSGAYGAIRALAGAYLAQPFCDRELSGPISLVSRGAEDTTVLYRFTCSAEGGTRALPREAYQGDLPLVSSRDFTVPDTVPSWIVPAAFVRSQHCGDCHAESFAAWKHSAHARTMAWATDSSAVVRFDKPAPSGSKTMILGTGRTQQAQLWIYNNGRQSLSPNLWVSGKLQQIADYYGKHLTPSADGSINLGRARCVGCHSTFLHSVQGGQRAIEFGVGCEACHGPGRAHVRYHETLRGRAPDSDPYADARSRSPGLEESCRRCHGLNRDPGVWDPRTLQPRQLPVGLEDPRVLADGRGWAFAHQWAAFSSSPCHLVGKATCTHCHSAHSVGSQAKEAIDDANCSGCHDRGEHCRPARKVHAAATSRVRCVDCHMPSTPFRNDSGYDLSFTDHGISIPRPAEATLLETRSACLNCHSTHNETWVIEQLCGWGASDANSTRAWVEAIALLKRRRMPHDAGQKAGLDAALSHPNHLVVISALRMLARRAADASLVPRLQAFASHRDPGIRAAALGALITHDVTGRKKWLAAVADDPGPLVRMELTLRVLSRGYASEAFQRQALRDILMFGGPWPEFDLRRLSTLRRSAGMRKEAEAIDDLLLRFTAPAGR
ncbi:MAG: ammonia-forming cytochrome c nitrite reductase subunit c552 [Anaerolineae bacterium]|nr:ammonia-forming cytochrome c nitrite reductase subunit c552 [Anaerolineae bacterium]